MSYLRLAPYAVIALLAIAVLWYRNDAKAERYEKEKIAVELSTVKQFNEQQKRAIDRLTAMREQNDNILADITQQLASINTVVADTQGTISELEKINEDVRAYMASSIPPDLRRVLNKQ